MWSAGHQLVWPWHYSGDSGDFRQSLQWTRKSQACLLPQHGRTWPNYWTLKRLYRLAAMKTLGDLTGRIDRVEVRLMLSLIRAKLPRTHFTPALSNETWVSFGERNRPGRGQKDKVQSAKKTESFSHSLFLLFVAGSNNVHWNDKNSRIWGN